MGKVLVIGIDGMDVQQIARYEQHLPTLKKLKDAGLLTPLSSVFPPDTIPAWMSIYTGLNPANHGVVNFLDLAKRSRLVTDVNSHKVRGKTFWDIAGRAGKEVCVVLPFAIFPPWPVNGVMICRNPNPGKKENQLQSYPEKVCNKKVLGSKLRLYHGIPSQKALPKFLSDLRKRAFEELKLGLRVLDESNWDLFFVYFSTLDAVQHVFWDYCYQADSSHQGGNAFSNVILEFYRFFDRVIAEFAKRISSGTSILIVSDHGLGMRPYKEVEINFLLRKIGLLEPKTSVAGSAFDLKVLKSLIYKLVSRFGLGETPAKLMLKVPIWREAWSRPSNVDWEKTVAYVSNISAIKAYSTGGIIVKNVGSGYEEVRNKVIYALSHLSDPNNGKSIVIKALKREELYSGPHISKYPDIVFELDQEYGVGWDIEGPLINRSLSRLIQPGAHKRDSAIFGIMSKNVPKLRINEKNVTALDIAPTALQLLGLRNNVNFDGRNVVDLDAPE